MLMIVAGCESANVSLLDAGGTRPTDGTHDSGPDAAAGALDAAVGGVDAAVDGSTRGGGYLVPPDAAVDGCGSTCCPSQASLEADALIKPCMRLVDNSCGNDATDPHERCFRSIRLPVESLGGIVPMDGLLLGGSVAVGDLDADGQQDIVVVQRGEKDSVAAHAVVAYYGKPAGKFEAPVLVGAVGESAGAVQALDLDYDGLLDVALTAALSGRRGGLVIYYGDGKRSFARKEFELPAHPPKAFHVVNAAGGLGQDILLDGGLLLIRDTAREYLPYERITLAGMQLGGIVSTSDLDADNVSDFLGQLAPQGGGVVGLYFVSNLRAPAGAASLVPEGIGAWTTAANLFGDARSEIVGFKPGGGVGPVRGLELEVRALEADGSYSGTPLTSTLTPLSKTRGAAPARILVGDLDDDSKQDVAYIAATEFSTQYPEAECDVPPSWRTVNILWGDGDGHAAAPACQFVVQAPPQDLQWANISHDGTDDLVVLTRNAVEILASIPR